MNGNLLKKTKKYAMNPIGIIGLFLVLVEAIAAVVVVKSSLNDCLNLILVLFIVIFPCVVLLVFYLLVTKHHEKLYSPSDYQDEENFVRTYDIATQSKTLRSSDDVSLNLDIEPKGGMNKEDIDVIKQMLNNITSMQKAIFQQNKQTASVAIIEDIEKDINTRLDSYAIEKQSDYKILVSFMKDCNSFIKALQDKGYNAYVYGKENRLKNYSDSEAIWLGRKVPVDIAVDVIKLAKFMFPHLKYIEVNNDQYAPKYVDYQIYIGGATSTANERNLAKMSIKNFEEIYSFNDIETLHAYIDKLNAGCLL